MKSTNLHMQRINQQLISILEREFNKALGEGKGPFDTIQQQADFLKIDKASMSKYRTGKTLTSKKARQIAEAFRTDSSEIALLVEELLNTQATPAESEREVHAWIKDRSNDATLMLVEFREVPVISEGRGNTEQVKELAKTIAESVAAGLSYGMFLPFNLADMDIKAIPTALLGYLSEIQLYVEKTYENLQKEILEFVYEENTTDSNVKVKLKEAVQRLKLYVSIHPPSPNPGIGYRLFFVQEDGIITGQQWEWVSLPDNTHQMVQKNPSLVGLMAIATRFSPIPEFWSAKNCLPQTDKEIADRANDLGTSVLWKVFKSEDLSPEKVVAKFLKDK